MTLQSEAAREAQIKEAGCDAPRLTPADIDKAIIGVTYTMLPSEKCMVCEITLRNGFTVRGESSVVSKENFRESLGKEYSYRKARPDLAIGSVSSSTTSFRINSWFFIPANDL